MELEYVYTKLRSEFGKQCIFSDRTVEIIDYTRSSSKPQRDYIFRNPVHQYSQCSETFAEHYVNTESSKYLSSSMNHSEGGWPKDINLNDEEQPKRYRRKIEREDNYITAVSRLANDIEQFIVQNTSVNIYEHYFIGLEPAPAIENNFVRTVNVYQDPSPITRPITHISWSPNTNSKLAISYCDMTFQPEYGIKYNNSYIWEVENPNMPQLILKPPVQLVCLEYHLKDTNCLVGGMLNGQISLWDTRRGHDMVECTVVEESHLEPVRDVLWINSKTGTEFFSGSSDGQVKWWDTRKLSAPTEEVILDMVRFGEDQQLPRAQGVSCLEYEPTIPTRFMVGTEHGYVINGNRKGKNHLEKLVSKSYATRGPVYALQRNTAYTKIFMTVGDSRCQLWSEECRESFILSTIDYPTYLTGGAWSPTRYSVFYLIRDDGILDIWDILQNQRDPMKSAKLCDDPLTAIRFNSESGRLAVVGNQKGTTYLVEMSDNYAQNLSHEKALIGSMFDRETLREKIMESRMRELRLKSRMKTYYEETESATDLRMMEVENEFYEIIDAELNPPGSETTPSIEEEPEPEPPPPPPPPPLPPVSKKEKKKGKKGKK